MTRLWVDANVWLRYLTGDPEELAVRCARLMQRAEAGEVRLYLSQLTFAEIVWVLKSFYQRSMDEIAEVLIRLLHAPGVEAEDRELMSRALELSRDRNLDYADAVLVLQAMRSQEAVCTLDATDFRRLPGEWLEPD